VRRGLALATGLCVAVVYVSAAIWSGQLSPLARRPLLDGLAPPEPYRWVEPPPELASTNVAPTRQSFRIELQGTGSETTAITTDDAQVTMIFPERAFADAPQQRYVQVTIEPLGASEVGAPEPPTQIRGNAYLIEANYRPSGALATLETSVQVVLVYPLVPNDHGGHEVLVSADGEVWSAVVTNDLPSVLQADAQIESLEYVAIGGQPPSPTASPTDTGGATRSNAAAVVISVAIGVLVAGVAWVLWPGSARRSRRER
jgi:hypothetical protein